MSAARALHKTVDTLRKSYHVGHCAFGTQAAIPSTTLMYRGMVSYYYVTVLHLFGYSVNGHISIRVRVRVWYYFIFRDRYMK